MNPPNRADSMVVRLSFYHLVVWAALLIAQSLGGGLPEIITNLTAAMEHGSAAWASPRQVNAMFA